MALRNNRFYFLLTWLPLLAVAAGALLGRAPGGRQGLATTADYGRYSAQQIFERAEPLCRTLAPDPKELRIAVSDKPLHRVADGRAGWVWEVTWHDGSGREGCLLLDADTGNVDQVSRQDYIASESLPLSVANAERAAQRWLEVLSGPSSAPWRLQSQPQHLSRSWYCRFVSTRSRAYVTLAADGQLLYASFR